MKKLLKYFSHQKSDISKSSENYLHIFVFARYVIRLACLKKLVAAFRKKEVIMQIISHNYKKNKGFTLGFDEFVSFQKH